MHTYQLLQKYQQKKKKRIKNKLGAKIEVSKTLICISNSDFEIFGKIWRRTEAQIEEKNCNKLIHKKHNCQIHKKIERISKFLLKIWRLLNSAEYIDIYSTLLDSYSIKPVLFKPKLIIKKVN